MFEAIHAQRLLKLADHLDYGKLGLKFHFESYRVQTSCGTAGCALGDCRTVFGKDFNEDDFGRAVVRAIEFFGITFNETMRLFAPWNLHNETSKINVNSTKEEVASHIRSFVERKCKEVGLSLGATLVEKEVGERVMVNEEVMCAEA